MDQVARGWLVLELTGSTLALGSAFALRGLPILLFGAIAGVTADRFPRKLQLLGSQGLHLVVNTVLLLLIVTGQVELWHVLATAFMSGVAQAFQQPARQSVLPGLVPREHLANAVGLSSAGLSLMRTIGPTVAGILIAAIGTAGTYGLQAALYGLAMVLTAFLHVKPLPADRVILSPVASLIEGLNYVRRHELVATIMIVVLIPVLLTGPYIGMLSVFARDILDIGSTGLGLLLTCTGLGSVAGAMWLASYGGAFQRKGLVVLIGAIVVSLSVGVFAVSTWLPLSLAMLLLSGIANSAYYSMSNTLLHSNIDDAVRGRVMSVFFLEQGLVPFGTFVLGAMADIIGAPSAVAGMAFLSAGMMVVVLIRSKRLRQA
jgi:MFS family permease